MLRISLARKALQAANVSGSSATGFTSRSVSMQTKTIQPLSMLRRLAVPVAAAAFAGAALMYMSEAVHAQPEKPLYSRGSIESRMNLVEPKTILRALKEDEDGEEEDSAHDADAEDQDPAHDADAEGNADAIENAEEAFDERTGEINWDCPCLGGMADGPCGETFKAAFSCFVFSEQEPKGIDCVDKFKLMQDCFRKHPEVYAEEIKADDEAEAEAENAVAED